MATNYQFLQKIRTDGQVSNFDLQNIFNKGYQEYNIFLEVHNGASDGGYMGLQFYDSSNTLINGNEYDWAGMELKSETGYDLTWYAENNGQIAPIMTGTNDDSRGGGALIRIISADDIDSYTFITAQSSSLVNAGLRGTKTIGTHIQNEKVSGVRFVNNSMAVELTARIYGIL